VFALVFARANTRFAPTNRVTPLGILETDLIHAKHELIPRRDALILGANDFMDDENALINAIYEGIF
jgi:hypothetical protein